MVSFYKLFLGLAVGSCVTASDLVARGSANTINVSTHYTADGLVQLVASIEDACTAKPVALSDSCSLSFECDGAAIPSATQSLSTLR